MVLAMQKELTSWNSTMISTKAGKLVREYMENEIKLLMEGQRDLKILPGDIDKMKQDIEYLKKEIGELLAAAKEMAEKDRERPHRSEGPWPRSS